jgi:DNA polymerase delta subunit 2
MDMIMTELAAALPVDIMPGACRGTRHCCDEAAAAAAAPAAAGPDDPANVSLPQQPLHACLFPGAAPYSSFRRTPNPHAFALAGGISILGSSGQAVNDMALYTRGRSRHVTAGWCVCGC